MASKIEITPDQIAAAYDIAGDVFDKKLSRPLGEQRLHDLHGMSPGSAKDIVEVFLAMMAGREFHRTLNIDGTRYFLERIEQDRPSYLANAVASNVKHLDYYEQLRTRRGTLRKAPTKRKLIAEWVERLSSPRDLNEFETAFQRSVDHALADAPDARRRRLETAGKIPEKIRVTTDAYVRNPDVVAEVLHRAQGLCGQCNQPAPFFRRKDGSPYLEVHHVQQLKDGGEDTVENAIALCPNCHREQHFGQASNAPSAP